MSLLRSQQAVSCALHQDVLQVPGQALAKTGDESSLTLGSYSPAWAFVLNKLAALNRTALLYHS
jgi:hypothetical protein